MSTSGTCVECGTPLPASGSGYCPLCCLRLAVESEDQTTAPAGVALHSVGAYELLEQVGEGGMGVVFKARQRALNRIVAVKMLRSGSLAGQAEIKRFRIEAQAAARLQHPNIVSIHEVGDQEGHLFFSMDFIQGRTLSQIAGRTPLPPVRAARYCRTIAQAIHHAHTQGVLHRDLKPGNVMIDAQDQPRITDFGLAKATDTDADLSLSGGILGTPSYMSPEQAAGKRGAAAPATDIYAVGAILYDLLTGRPPFRADSPVETMRQVIESEPAPPRLLNARIDRDLETICLKCLAKDPRRRYDTAQELSDDLERYLNREPIHARRIGTVARVHRWTRRHPSLAALSGVFVLMFVLVAYFSLADAVDSAQFGAWQTAETARAELADLESHVLAMADNRELLSMLAQEPGRRNDYKETAATNRYVQVLSSLFQEHAVEPNKRSRFENLLLSHHNGDVLANHNPHDPPDDLVSVAPRDYFQGARDLPPRRRVYISKAFRSEAGHQKYKIAISVPLRDGSGSFLGVLSAMLDTATNKVPAGVSSSRTQTARVAELDLSILDQANARTNQDSGVAYAFFWHPKYEHGRTNLVVTRHAHVAQALTQPPGETVLVDKFYRDPVLAESWLYGWWVAGFARVGDTHLVVVHQIRNRAVQAFFLGTLLSALVALAGIASVLRKRRRLGCAPMEAKAQMK